MSIPLIQKPEKDDINTSIIAIKRNIERINMLLGLSNSEEIDTSKFATKEELQQAVTDLQPVDEVALNNMHSVSSNAVADSLSYSTTEQLTGGVWIDGKPIYRKVLSIPNPTVNTAFNYVHNLSMDTLVKYYGRCKVVGEKMAFPTFDSGANSALHNSLYYIYENSFDIICGWGSMVTDLTIVVEYTKTTD